MQSGSLGENCSVLNRLFVARSFTFVHSSSIILRTAVCLIGSCLRLFFASKSSKVNTISPSFYASISTQRRLKLTISISPVFLTKTRTRPVTVLSQEGILKIEEMKKTHFSAQRIIARKQYSWTRKICEVQVAGIEPESFAFRAIALDH